MGSFFPPRAVLLLPWSLPLPPLEFRRSGVLPLPLGDPAAAHGGSARLEARRGDPVAAAAIEVRPRPGGPASAPGVPAAADARRAAALAAAADPGHAVTLASAAAAPRLAITTKDFSRRI